MVIKAKKLFLLKLIKNAFVTVVIKRNSHIFVLEAARRKNGGTIIYL